MRQINVSVDDSVYEAAKAAAASQGMLFKRWIERAVKLASEKSKPAERAQRAERQSPWKPCGTIGRNPRGYDV